MLIEGMLVPFYQVIETTVSGVTNMIWDKWSNPLMDSELEITCLKNKRAVKKNELLEVFKVPVIKAGKRTKTVIMGPPPKRARVARKGVASASSSTAVEPTRAGKNLSRSVEAAAEADVASKAKGAGKGTGKGKGKGKGCK